jgi:hypothetical protein
VGANTAGHLFRRDLDRTLNVAAPELVVHGVRARGSDPHEDLPMRREWGALSLVSGFKPGTRGPPDEPVKDGLPKSACGVEDVLTSFARGAGGGAQSSTKRKLSAGP